MADGNTGWRAVARGSAVLFVLGLVGVVALGIFSVPTLREIPELASVSFPALVAIASVNSVIFLAVFVMIGAVTAPRVGLRSGVVGDVRRRRRLSGLSRGRDEQLLSGQPPCPAGSPSRAHRRDRIDDICRHRSRVPSCWAEHRSTRRDNNRRADREPLVQRRENPIARPHRRLQSGPRSKRGRTPQAVSSLRLWM